MVTAKQPRKAEWTDDERRWWRELIRHLNALFPVGHVTVWRRPIRGLYGYYVPANGGGMIRIGNHLPWPIAVDTLTEEWAHAVAWPISEDRHDEHWAIEFARVKAAVQAWLDEEDE